MDDLLEPTPFVFYLQLNTILPTFFFKMSELLSSRGIKLIPIRFDDLMAISKGNRAPLLTINKSLKTNKVLERYKRRYLDLSIINNKFIHFDVSSFRASESLNKSKWMDRYIHIKLPQDVEDLCLGILKVIKLENKKNHVWPGGNRGKPLTYQDIMDS